MLPPQQLYSYPIPSSSVCCGILGDSHLEHDIDPWGKQESWCQVCRGAGPQAQPGAQHQLTWGYPLAEVAASPLTLAVLSAEQQSAASCSPWAS